MTKAEKYRLEDLAHLLSVAGRIAAELGMDDFATEYYGQSDYFWGEAFYCEQVKGKI